jgi:malonate transporter and related proteins
MVVTVLHGFVAAWHHDVGSKDAPILNRMVLVYAVPLALFAGTVTTSRAQLCASPHGRSGACRRLRPATR